MAEGFRERPKCSSCKISVGDMFFRDPDTRVIHCDTCYRLVKLGLITPDGKTNNG